MRIVTRRLVLICVTTVWTASLLLTSVSPVFAQDWPDLSSDVDGDGLLNDMETDGWYNGAGGPFVTDPLDADTDDDGLTDGDEKLFDTDPLDEQDPGIYVRYQDSFYTREYFRVADPTYLSMKQAGDRYLMTEAMVVRRGTTFHIGGPSEGTLTIDGNGYTSLIPTAEKDLYGGGWAVAAPESGRVGIFTATVSLDAWEAEMPIYVIFELPAPTGSLLPWDETLTQEGIEAFVYNNDPSDVRDETGVIWYTGGPAARYTCRCDQGCGPPCYNSDNFYHAAHNWAQAFVTEQYQKWIFLDKVLWRIHGQTSQYYATDVLSDGADQEVRVDYYNYGGGTPGQPPLSYQISYVLDRWYDGVGETQTGTACHAQAGALTTFLRSAGIPAQPFITDWWSGGYDTSVRVWLNDQWYAARSYRGGEHGDDTWAKYYPFSRGPTGHTYQRPLHLWDTYGGYSESSGHLIVTASEDWDWEMVNTGNVGEDLPTGRDYKWDSRWPLRIEQKHPFATTLSELLWIGDSWLRTGWPGAYGLPDPYPGGDISENWPIEPVPQSCPSGFTGDCPYPNEIGDRVWNDIDGDGHQDGGEPGITGVIVTMTLLSPNTVYTATTAGDGTYEFRRLPAGAYVLTVDDSTLPSGAVLTTGNDPLTVNILAEDSYADADFGYQISGGGMAADAAPSVGGSEGNPLGTPLEAQVSSHHVYLPLVALSTPAESSPVRLGPVVDDYGVDVDGDGRFDALVVEVETTTSRPGVYTLAGILNVPGATTAYGGIYADTTRVYLHLGTQTVQLAFDGSAIVDAGADGPYQMADLWITDLEEFDPRLGPWDGVLHSEQPDYVTAPYAVDQFGMAEASFANVYGHRGIDEDGDGRYESVEIDVALDIPQPGRYRVEGDLYDGKDGFIGHATWAGSGSSAALVFEVESTMPPYTLEQLQLRDAHGRMLDLRQRDVYAITDLNHLVDRGPVALGSYVPPTDPGSIRPMGEHITPTLVFDDRGIDLDADGLYDQLVVDVEVQVTRGDHYRIEGWLKAPDDSLVVYGISDPKWLSIGSHRTLSLPFDGRAINGYGVVSGDYTVVALRILDDNTTSYNVLDEVNVTGLDLDYNAQYFEPASLVDTVFSDDMESGSANWTWDAPPWSYNSVSWPWPTVNWKAASSSHSGSLELTGVDLSEHSAPVLRFNTTFDLSSPNDAGYVEASDDGISWTRVATYTDEIDRWATKFVELGDFGEIPSLHLRFNADAHNDLLWYVDDVYVYAGSLLADVSFIHLPQPVLAGEATTFIVSYSFLTPTLPVTLTWDFGDGSPIQVTHVATITHQYPQALDHSVVVTAENGYHSATAEEIIEVHALLNVDVVGNGTVSKNPDQAAYRSGDVVELTADASTGWSFVNWSGDLGSSTSPQSITISDSKEVTATFTPDEYTLTVDTVGDGSVIKDPDQAIYYYGDVVELAATADLGWTFVNWSGDLSGSTNPQSLSMTGDRTVTAIFWPDEYTLTTNVVGNGSVIRDPDQSTYYYGDEVEVTAVPAAGWQFVGWSGDLSGSTNPRSITMTSDKNVTATFVPIEYTLTVNISGNGTVSKNPDQVTYHYGDVVQLTANANLGWSLSHWSGDLTGSDNPGSLTITGDTNVTATFTEDEYALTINTNGSGSVSKTPDQATYSYGQVVDLAATPTTGWRFSHWSGDLTGSDNPKPITMDGNKTVTANFSQDEYNLTVNVVGNGGVTKNPDQTTYHYGDTVALTANPATGWSFAGWSGDLSGTTNPESIAIYGHRTVTATFTQDEYTLSVDTVGGGSVTKNPDQATYHYGDVVQLTAEPNAHWSFSEWSGDLSGSTNPQSITMTGDKSVTASFTPDGYLLTINYDGDGSVSRDPDQDVFLYGEVVTLTAAPAPGWTFTGWSGDLSGSAAVKTLTMDGDKTVTAHFMSAEYELDLHVSGSGSITREPWQSVYVYGDVVTLTANANPSWVFTGWDGDLSGSDNPTTITMDGDKYVEANFTFVGYSLAVNVVGGGSTVKDPDEEYYGYNDGVTVTAVTAPDWRFEGWSGDLTGSLNPQSLTMNGNKEVTATFVLDEYPLNINVIGNGGVIKTPDQDMYINGRPVTLTASPDPGWSFAGWSGDLTGGAISDVVTIGGDTTVTATFTRDEYTLTVIPVGGGDVTTDPQQTTYYYGDEVELTATPSTGWAFAGWSGDMVGSASSQSTVIAGNQTITATFALIEYTLTVNVAGEGSVTRTPNQSTYHYGDVVILTAVPVPGWSFVAWSGNLSGSENPTTITIDGNKSVVANFTQDEYTLTVNVVGQGAVTEIPDQDVYHYGDTVTLATDGDIGWTLAKWSGDLSGSDDPATVTIQGNTTITATFALIEYDLDIDASGDGSVARAPDQPTYHYGDLVTLTAQPDVGWGFDSWFGDLNGYQNPDSLVITGDTQVSAMFYRLVYSFALDVVGSGSVSVDPEELEQQIFFYYGDVITLTATPSLGWSFVEWSGDLSGDTDPQVLIFDDNKAVTANFEQDEYTLSADTVGEGSVAKTPDQSTYHYGDIVTLTATPTLGWEFVDWGGDLSGSDNPTVIIMTGDTTFTATFAPIEYTLSADVAGQGSVVQMPDQPTYHYGDVVTLTAAPIPGWSFVNWSGDLSGSDDPATITVLGDTTVTATFALIEYTLDVDVIGSGGSVLKTPNQPTYHYGDVVTLTATASAGWGFDGWSGNLHGYENLEVVVIDGDKQVMAIFYPYDYSVTYDIVGNGQVSREPEQSFYHYGDVVTLTATSDPGWSFAEWTGDLSGSANPQALTVQGNKHVTANFEQDEYTLSADSVGEGSVAKTPDQSTYHYGDVVTLTATPTLGWEFVDWGGDLSGSDNPTVIIMTGDTTFTATFAPIEYTLSADVVGQGSVVQMPDQPTYHYGDVVTLTATPVPGWSFVAWSGDLGGGANPQSLTISGNHTVTATFEHDEHTLTVDVVGQGSVAKIPDQSTYHYGDVVTFTATPVPGWSFVAWSGDLGGSANPQSLTITGHHNITATFEQDEYTLAVDVVGQGNVTQTPGQPTYHYGDTVTLTATPDAGHHFAGWTGDLGGDDSPVTLVIDGHKHVTATFAPVQPVTDVAFTVRPDAPVAGAALTFTVAFTPDHATQPVTYTWDFDDGGDPVVTTVPQVIHTFAASGRYTVSLTATNGYGLPCTHSAQVAVAAQTEPDRLFFLPLVVRGTTGSAGSVP